MDWLPRNLVLHGSLVLLAGFVGGFFFARAIKSGEREVAWRVVHSGASIAGVLLIALAPIVTQLMVPAWLGHLLGWSLIVGIDAFVVGMIWAALSGSRGLSRGGTWHNRTVYTLYAVGIVCTMLGCVWLVGVWCGGVVGASMTGIDYAAL